MLHLRERKNASWAQRHCQRALVPSLSTLPLSFFDIRECEYLSRRAAAVMYMHVCPGKKINKKKITRAFPSSKSDRLNGRKEIHKSSPIISDLVNWNLIQLWTRSYFFRVARIRMQTSVAVSGSPAKVRSPIPRHCRALIAERLSYMYQVFPHNFRLISHGYRVNIITSFAVYVANHRRVQLSRLIVLIKSSISTAMSSLQEIANRRDLKR